MTNFKAFWGKDENLFFINRQPLLNQVFSFFYEDETIFDFPGYASAFFRVYDEREEQLIKSFSVQITRNSNNLVFNCSVSDMTFQDLGKYWYEMGYSNGGYEIILRFGKLQVV